MLIDRGGETVEGLTAQLSALRESIPALPPCQQLAAEFHVRELERRIAAVGASQ